MVAPSSEVKPPVICPLLVMRSCKPGRTELAVENDCHLLPMFSCGV
ncbi:MAG: hypothetical protein Ct9H300mP32_3230 [Verrucomicrobiota bacterium]|nr:MAG: hypothetical protein Ct9H300mP32_3230 [Verrucomicrobiota bacterium]